MKTYIWASMMVLSAALLLAGCKSLSFLGGNKTASSDPYSSFHPDDTVCDNGLVWRLNW